MRFPSGVTDQYIYFVAVDSADLITRETGLSSFTVYRARNGAAAAAYTTPTIAEVSAANMPGVYSLLLDEDMTIAAGDHSQEIVLHITQASMAPVTLKYELYRPDVTAGETVTVSSGAVSTVTTTTTATNVTTVNGLASGVITATSIAADAIGASELAADAATEIATAVWATATRQLTAIDEDTTTLDLDATIRAAVGLASANLDTQFTDTNTNINANETLILDLPTNAELNTALGTADDATLAAIAALEAKVDIVDANVDAVLVDTGTDIPALINDLPTNAELNTALGTADDAVLAAIAALPAAPSAASVADAVWDEPLAGHLSAGSTGEALDGAGGGSAPTAAEIADAVWDEDLTTHVVADSTGEALATAAAGGGVTPPTVDEIADELETRVLDVNIVQVNEINVQGVGSEANPWGP